jgi:hypothetical protein
LDNNPGVARHRQTSLVLKGDALHRELDDIRHVHGVSGTRLELNKLENAVDPVRAIQTSDQLSSVRSEGLLSVRNLGLPKLIGQAALITCILSAMSSIEEDQCNDEHQRDHNAETFSAHRPSVLVRAACSLP